MVEARASDLRGGAWPTRWGRRERGWRGARWAHARVRERTVLGEILSMLFAETAPFDVTSAIYLPGSLVRDDIPRLPRKSSHSEVYARSRANPPPSYHVTSAGQVDIGLSFTASSSSTIQIKVSIIN